MNRKPPRKNTKLKSKFLVSLGWLNQSLNNSARGDKSTLLTNKLKKITYSCCARVLQQILVGSVCQNNSVINC